jgi:D-alanyl-D-alanine carboxypeptidase
MIIQKTQVSKTGWINPRHRAELLQIIRDKDADFEPGTRNEYCNTNYLLLSYILEKVTQLPYETNLQKRIVSKIGLKDTYVAKASETTVDESISYKYANASWNPVKQTDPGIHSGAGAIVSTPGDLVVFIQALFTGKLIKKSSLEKMTTITDDYGKVYFLIIMAQ